MRAFVLYIILFLHVLYTFAQVDDVKAARLNLEKRRQELRSALTTTPTHAKPAILNELLKLGLWQEVLAYIQTDNKISPTEQKILMANYLWLTNDFKGAEKLIDEALTESPDHPEAKKQKARLAIEAWKLEDAIQQCRQLLQLHPGDDEVETLLGRALLLERNYEEALVLAKKMQKRHPRLGAAYLLEADVYFWNQHPEEAEPLLIKALQLDPFNADARFSYGYAIWRRIDATQLDQMAAQWELALALNPLHFQTHWHWGNGHTNLTFADYADSKEKEIREKLAVADSLVKQNKVDAAIALTKTIGTTYPQSVLPLMHQASIYYSDFDAADRNQRLDTAASLFREILKRKKHYGPAHNGLSAVIKSKRIPYLNTYDSIRRVLKTLKIKDPEHFQAVFPDVRYYPGDFAKAMVWNQLYTSTVYFPFLAKQGNTFVIPSLHEDLAIAMKRPFFRYSTTFDNRQWMDIRGVGSGAAAIEYVERGAYQERNVILHEYVHLFHGRVLTDQESRRIRALYYSAMQHNRTLDYYSRNNESEYLAQTYPAYFETVKVHPLDFKSMNTQSALKQKDPEMYAFLDSLVAKEKSYLAGNQHAMASNWAQVYVNLSQQKRKDPQLAAKLLDTALLYDANYQPAFLAYAQLELDQNRFQEAGVHLLAAEKINAQYAPIYEKYAELEAKQNRTEESLAKQAALLEKSLQLEQDYQNKASIARSLMQLYARNNKIGQAIEVAERYIKDGADISTYLRDRKDDARVFAAYQRVLLGDASQLAILDRISKSKPQQYDIRIAYADALTATKHFKEAIQQMKEVQRIFAANRNRRADFDLRIAENYVYLRQIDSASFYAQLIPGQENTLSPIDQQRLVRLQISLGQADKNLQTLTVNPSPEEKAAVLYTKAFTAEQQGDKTQAVILYEQAFALHPYSTEIYQHLVSLYGSLGKNKAKEELSKRRTLLYIPPFR